jgi:hypothetical protein
MAWPAPNEHDARAAMDGTWPPGTHLITPRRGYVHHGIYAGAGRVIHYAGFGRAWRRGPVEEVSIERFANGRGVQALPASAAAFGGAEAVARARMRLGEDRYRVQQLRALRSLVPVGHEPQHTGGAPDAARAGADGVQSAQRTASSAQPGLTAALFAIVCATARC